METKQVNRISEKLIIARKNDQELIAIIRDYLGLNAMRTPIDKLWYVRTNPISNVTFGPFSDNDTMVLALVDIMKVLYR